MIYFWERLPADPSIHAANVRKHFRIAQGGDNSVPHHGECNMDMNVNMHQMNMDMDMSSKS